MIRFALNQLRQFILMYNNFPVLPSNKRRIKESKNVISTVTFFRVNAVTVVGGLSRVYQERRSAASPSWLAVAASPLKFSWLCR